MTERLIDELERMALTGDGPETLVSRLAAHLHQPVWLLAPRGILAGGEEPPEHLSTVAVVDAPGEPRQLAVASPATTDVLTLLRAASLAFAIDAARSDAIAAATAENASWLIDQLRFGAFADAGPVVEAGRRFGLDLDEPFAAVLLTCGGWRPRAWYSAVRRIGLPVRVIDDHVWTVMNWGSAERGDALRERLDAELGEPVARVAIGPVVSSVGGSARTFHVARLVHALLVQEGVQRVLAHEDLGMLSLLAERPQWQLEAYVDRRLGALLARPDLFETLVVWLEEAGNRAASAKRLHIHPNSIAHRMSRIRQALGADPYDPGVAAELRSAVEAHRILRAGATLTPTLQA